MTVRELRAELTKVENQNLTVKELRDLLFQVIEQDKELTEAQMYFLTK